jgi:hypothetical protein
MLRIFFSNVGLREDEALMLQRDIAMLESPSPRVLAALREWLHGPSRASNKSSKLDGRDRDVFSVASDLVALRPPADTDPLSKLLRNHWPFPSEVGWYQCHSRLSPC